MQIWLTTFVLLFGLVEIYQWVQHFTLPLPIYILGGAFLAIASNYDKLSFLPSLKDEETPPSDPPAAPQTPLKPPQAAVWSPPPPPTIPPPPRPISFTIDRASKQNPPQKPSSGNPKVNKTSGRN